MKKLGHKRKLWLDRHSRQKKFVVSKELHITSHHSDLTLHQTPKAKARAAYNQRRQKFDHLTAPSHLSMSFNTEETLSFFAKIEKHICHGHPIYFDMQSIQILTIDAIMYFLAILKKLKFLKIVYAFKGSMPKNEHCNNLLQMSGFFDYVSSSITPDLTRNTSMIQIANGQYSETETAKKLCLFAMSKLNVNRQYIKKLYVMIIELMTNTKQHAYTTNKKQFAITEWYVFAKYVAEHNLIRFIFLDTGEGIPATVKKYFGEQLKDKLITPNPHTAYIQSALEGELLRTRTEMPYRGKGLPKIYSFHKDGYIKGLTIISNYGYFSSERTGDINQKLNGTLFCWELSQGN